MSAGDLAGAVAELSDLPARPFRDALLRGDPEAEHIARSIIREAARNQADTRLTAAVWEGLDRQPAVRAAELAARLGVSTRRLRQAVRHETGLSPRALRRLARHERAVAALADPRWSLAEVSDLAGYADQSHMTRETVALGGLTPARLHTALSEQ